MPVLLKLIFLAVLLAAAASDLRSRRIPNWLTLSGVVLGLGINTLLGGWHGFAIALGGCGLALAVYVPLYAVRALGAGDVKLMAAVGAFTGPAMWLDVVIATALLGGVLALILVVMRRRLKRTLLNVGLIVSTLLRRGRPSDRNPELNVRDRQAVTLPHGAVIAAGALICLALGKLG